MTKKQPKPNLEFIAVTWRKLVMFEAARAGLDPKYVLNIKTEAGGERDILKQRAIGCRHLAAYLAHTSFGIKIRHLVPHAKLRHQRLTQVMHAIENCREDDTYYDRWIATVEELVAGEVVADGG